MPFKQAQLVAQTYGWQRYFEKGSEPDLGILTQQPETLKLCVGIVVDSGSSNLQLDSAYSRLIGPDTAPLPRPPASASSAAPPASSPGTPK